MGQGKDRVNASPTELRKAIAQARTELDEHIRSLSDPTLPKNDLGAKKMQTKKIASAHAKTSTKSKAESNEIQMRNRLQSGKLVLPGKPAASRRKPVTCLTLWPPVRSSAR